MVDVFRIGILGIVGAFVAVIFKEQKREFSLMVAFGVCILIFGYAVQRFHIYLSEFSKLKEYLSGGEQYLATVLKVIGITYICEFSAGICKDAGFASMADQIEILGKITVMFVGMPILFAVIEQIQLFML
jgi:stage III sporulation protein AD